MLTRLLVLAGVLAAACAPSSSSGQEPPARSLGTGTLVVLDKGANTAALVDLASGDVYATLPTGVGPHEVAVSGDGRTAVVTDYGDQEDGQTLTVLDARTLQPPAVLPSARMPIRVRLTPDGRRALVSNAMSGELRIFDVATRRELSAIPLAASGANPVPVGVLVSPDGAMAYVAMMEGNEVAAVDLRAGRVVGRIRPGEGPDARGNPVV